MTSVVYPPATREIGDRRRELAPAIHQAFDAFFAHSTVALHALDEERQ